MYTCVYGPDVTKDYSLHSPAEALIRLIVDEEFSVFMSVLIQWKFLINNENSLRFPPQKMFQNIISLGTNNNIRYTRSIANHFREAPQSHAIKTELVYRPRVR